MERTKPMQTVVLLAALVVGIRLAAAAQALPSLPRPAAYGDYAVGVATGFAADNRQRFDPWNSAYGRPAYRALLRRVEAAGQTRTVVFQLWYPAPADTARGRLAGPRSPFPALSGRRANYFDFYFQDGDMARQLGTAAQVVPPEFIHLRGDDILAEADATTRRAALDDIAQRILNTPRGAYQDARAAQGKFPLVLLAHGLGGNHGMWSSLGEFLASHGYVVAAPTFISDGSLPLVFHDEDSPFAKQVSPEELQQAYELLLGEVKVVPYFYRLLFGQQGEGFAPPEGFDPATATLVPRGVERTTTMMRNLFRQRVADVGLVLSTVRLLGADKDTCRTALAVMGATSAARNLCGLLAGRVDGGAVGVAGHSLGSMTAQLAANHLPGVSAALGLNNAPPFSWTPEEMFGAGTTRDGLPIGSHAPLLLLVGDEDDFVQGIFIGLFQSAVARAGGDPSLAFPLAAERVAPDRLENPQPVALSAWQRATSERMLVIVRNTDHGTLAEDFARLFPWPQFQEGELPFGQTPERTRKPTGEQAFGQPGEVGESYTQLGWATVGKAGQVYLPHLIRDWYVRTWFDWHLRKDIEAGRRLRGKDPFRAMTAVRRQYARKCVEAGFAPSATIHGDRGAPVSTASEDDRQVPQPAQRYHFAPFNPVCCQPQPRHPPQQGRDRQLGFKPCQGRAQTVVDTVAEGDMRVVLTGDIEPVGCGKLRRVMVGRAEHNQDLLVLLNTLAANFDLAKRNPGRHLHRPVVSQELLNRGPNQAGGGPESGQLLGMPQQGQQPVANQIHRRLMAGRKQEDDVGQQLVFAQPVAGLFNRDQATEHILPRPSPPLSDQADKIGHKGLGRAVSGLDDFGRNNRVKRAGQRPGPVFELLPVFKRHANQFGNHNDRQRKSQLTNNVAAAPGCYPVQQLVNNRLDMGPHGLYHSRGKRLGHQFAQPGVIGRVSEQHPLLLHIRGRPLPAEGFDIIVIALPVTRIGAGLGMAQHTHTVGIAGQYPEVEGVAPVYRVSLAQLPRQAVGIVPELGYKRIELNRAGRGSCFVGRGLRIGHDSLLRARL